jgi:transposase, IS6 family
VEVTTDKASAYPRVIDERMPRGTARHRPVRHAIEADQARLRPMRGLNRTRSARTIAAGRAFVQNRRRGHYALTADLPVHDRIRAAFTEPLDL